MPTSKTSRLEAVNTILRATGEQPISSLNQQSGVGSVMAVQTLDETDRQIQLIGWSWNTRAVTLSPGAFSKIAVPGNYIRIIAPRGTHYTVRGGNLFYMEEGTDEFSESVDVSVVELLEWDNLPEAARHYITIKAARKFADRQVGDDMLSRYTRQDEAEALGILRNHEAEAGQYTIFTDEDAAFLNRGSPFDWIEG